jgi:putative exporter of polyketide antibiotics
MLTYLWGDVLRIFSGHAKAGEVLGKVASQGMWLLISVLFLIPIVMLVLSLTVSYPAIRWANIIAAIFLIVLNLFGLPYKGAYDNLLIVVSLVFNAMTVWYAWKWAG